MTGMIQNLKHLLNIGFVNVMRQQGYDKKTDFKLPAAVLMMFFPQLAMAAQGQDLMASGNTTVKATFGKDSSVVKWVVLAEVLVGAVMYMMTKNVKFLAGFAIISVFIAVGMAVVGLK
jgi:type IV conjugative transfer system pilin TraA